MYFHLWSLKGQRQFVFHFSIILKAKQKQNEKMSPMSLFLLTSAFDWLLKMVLILAALFTMCIFFLLATSIFIFAIGFLLKTLGQRGFSEPFQNFIPYDYMDLREPEAEPVPESKMTIVEKKELNRLDLESQDIKD